MFSDQEREKLREEFMKIYDANIKREGRDKLLDWLNKSDFFTAPASSRYHGNYPAGLLAHSLNVYHCLIDQVKLAGLSEKYSDETLALVALMHDICKVHLYKKGFRNVKNDDGQWYKKEVYEYDELFPCGHGEKSVIILQRFMELQTDEIWAIRAHMGGFDTSQRVVGDIFERSKLAVLLHIADMYATYMIEGV